MTTNEPVRAGGSQPPASSPNATSVSIPTEEPSGVRPLRGFAAMDKTRRQEIASRGGRSAHAKGKAHRFTPDEARDAGRIGGASVSKDRAHMSTIGRIGGQKSTSHHRTEPEIERPAPKAVTTKAVTTKAVTTKKKKKGAKKAKRKR